MTKKFLKILEEQKISESSIEKLWYSIENLEDIYNDLQKKTFEYEEFGKYLAGLFLQEVPKLHSIKFRVKSPESLIKKIIQKEKIGLSVNTYENEITDILWIRVLILDQEDWVDIHNFLEQKWNFNHKIAYVSENRKGKYTSKFNWSEIQIKDWGYTSLHYIITSSPIKKIFNIEIQVRTILEEAWWEIDHMIKYKKAKINTKQGQLELILDNLNRLVIEGNEMISLLKKFHSNEKIYMKDIIKLNQVLTNSDVIESSKMKEIINRNLSSVHNLSTFINADFSRILGESSLKTIESTVQNVVNKQKEFIEQLNKSLDRIRKNTIHTY